MDYSINEVKWRLDCPKTFRTDVRFDPSPDTLKRLEAAREALRARGKHIYQRPAK